MGGCLRSRLGPDVAERVLFVLLSEMLGKLFLSPERLTADVARARLAVAALRPSLAHAETRLLQPMRPEPSASGFPRQRDSMRPLGVFLLIRGVDARDHSWNCASSVEPFSASVEELPPLITVETWSK